MGWPGHQFNKIEETIKKLEEASKMNHDIMICPKHFKCALAYSRQKEYFVCHDCEIEKDSSVLSFREYTEIYKIIIDKDLDIDTFRDRLRTHMTNTMKTFTYFITQIHQCIQKVRELDPYKEEQKSAKKYNYELLSTILNSICEAQDKLSYNSEVLDQIREKISIEKLVRRYFEVQKFIATAKVEELKFYLRRLNIYMMRINCLNFLKGIKSLNELKDEELCALIYSNIFKRVSKVNCREDEFCAFDGANLLPNVIKLINSPFKNTVGEVRYTQSLVEKSLCYGGLNMICSVSPKGVLSVYRYVSGNHILNLYDLVTNSHSEITWITDFTTVVFYNSKAFLFIHGCDLTYFKEVDKCMGEDNRVETFDAVPNGGMCLFADSSIASSTGHIYYTNGDIIDEKLIKFNLKTLTFTEFDFTMEPTITRTGIMLEGISFLANKDKGILAMTKEGEIDSSIKSNVCGYAVLPSNSVPNDIRKALVIMDGNKCFYSGKDFCINSAFKPTNKLAIIRIYKDVFLVRDKKDNSWKYLRIHVP